MSDLNLPVLVNESFAFLDLGLHDEALATVERLLAGSPDREVHLVAIQVFIRLGAFDRACASADALIKGGVSDAEDLSMVSLAYNFGGRIQEAYDLQKGLFPKSNESQLGRLYGLACKASRLGRHKEALNHLLACFRFTNVESWDAYRKVFLDSELADLWEVIPSMQLSLREAMRHCNVPFDEILKMNTMSGEVRCVDFLDLKVMPSKFQALLRPVHGSTFETSPLVEMRQPELFQEYLAWQDSLVAPRLEVFRALGEMIHSTVVAEQLSFAEFQASRGRIACARNHLVCHLLESPGASVESLPDIPALRPLVEEFRAQHAESPESFRYLISWECKDNPEEFIRDVYSELPEVNRGSGYALLALGSMHYRLGNTASAIECWSSCASKWPKDDAPVMNATILLSGENRWDEATKLINRLPGSCLDSMLWKSATRAIKERRQFTISSKVHPAPRIPTPTFGHLYSGADEEFLHEKRKLTPLHF
jgi:tetratricopeptide (TPR) repeat protein